MPAQTVIKLRRGTAAEWTSANPVLAAGEVGLETDTYKTKYGNGATAWTSLPYSVASSSGSTSVDWADVLNKPTEFTPEAHTHLLAEITDVTATAAELNALDGITATVTELNYTDGVTSNIQTQLDGKSATSHTHDDRYYTETETDTLLNGKADLSGATFTGNVEGPTVRLTSGTDVTLSSTAHAFQIGSDASQNLAFDGNEIQSRNNGAAGTLIVNADGGNVYVGTLSNGVGFGKSETEGKVWANGVYDNTLTTAYRSVYVSSTGTLDFLGYVASSSREKKNIEPLGYTAEQILLVEPKQYHYNAEADTDPKHAGMIAEDMHDAGLTAFVSYDKEGLPASINYEFYVAALQQVVRAQAEQIASLDARLTALEG